MFDFGLRIRKLREQHKLSQEQLKELQQLKQGTVSEEVLIQVQGINVGERLLQIISGCAYINCMLSDGLKSIVKICGAIDVAKTLDMFVAMDGRKDFVNNGGDYDQILGISPRNLIIWAVTTRNGCGYHGCKLSESGAKKILSVQFKKNRQIYLEYLKDASLDSSNMMLQVIQEMEPELYPNSQSSLAHRCLF